MKFKAHFLLVAILFAVQVEAATASTKTWRPDDFSVGFVLRPDKAKENNAIHYKTFSVDMHQALLTPAMTDIRVFNSAEEELPHALRRTSPEQSTEEAEFQEVPFFPLWAPEGEGLNSSDLQLKLETAEGKTRVQLSTASNTATDGLLGAYILDTSDLDAPIGVLRLELTSTKTVRHVSVAASDDLMHWRVMARNRPMVRLKRGSYEIHRNTVRLDPQTAKYIRVTWEGSSPLNITAAAVKVRSTVHYALDRVEVLEPVGESTNDASERVINFDSRGYFPITSVRLRLPEVNTVARITLASRPVAGADKDNPWRTRYTGTVFSLNEEGTLIESDPIKLSSTDRYWRVRVSTAGGGIGKSEPALELSYRPLQVVFTARGKGPYLLAIGNPATPASSFSAIELGARDTIDGDTGRIVERRDLGGPPGVQGPAFDRRWVLWGALLIGVLLLVGMALRMLGVRENHNDGGPENAHE